MEGAGRSQNPCPGWLRAQMYPLFENIRYLGVRTAYGPLVGKSFLWAILSGDELGLQFCSEAEGFCVEDFFFLKN